MAVADRPKEDHEVQPVEVTDTEAQNFMQQQILVNVGSRGWLEKAYYTYGSDCRWSGNAGYLLSYRAQRWRPPSFFDALQWPQGGYSTGL